MVALFLRPDADQSDGSWLNESASATNLFNSVDEPTTPSDTDYIVSSTTDGDKVRLRLSDPSGGVAAPLIVRYRCKRTGTQAANLIGRLYQGTSPGTLITTFTQLSVPDTFTTYTYTLTSGEFTSITDFTDLYVEFELSQQSSLKVDLNFAGGVYYDSGTVADATGVLSCIRASSGYATNTDGTLTSFASNTLRIGVGTGLLIEDARTNVLLDSQTFTTGNWTAGGLDVTASADQTAAPDGTTTADKLIEGSAVGGNHGWRTASAFSPTSNGQNTFTVYMKAAGRNFGFFRAITNGTADAKAIVVSLTTGAITDAPTTGSPTNVSTSVETLASGWYRLRITLDTTGTCYFQLSPSDSGTPSYSSGTPSYSGDGVSGVYVWGGQCELGSFPSSYIATSGSSASRAADAVSCTGNLDTLLKASARTSVVDVFASATPVTSDIVSGSTAGNELVISSSNVIITSNTATKDFTSSGLTFTGGVKVGAGTSSTATSVTGGGLTVATGASGTANTGTVYLGSDSTNYWYGYIRRATFWNSKLADATLQALTTP